MTTATAPQTAAPSTVDPIQARIRALPGIFQTLENRATEEQMAAKAVRRALKSTDSTRATLRGQWLRAKKAENYVLADRLQKQLDRLPADDAAVSEALQETALALIDQGALKPGSDLVARVAYRETVRTLVRRG